MRIILPSYHDGAETKQSTADCEVAGSNPARTFDVSDKGIISKMDISETARWILVRMVLYERHLNALTTCPRARVRVKSKVVSGSI